MALDPASLRALSSVNNIGFTEFTSGLIKGVFSAVVSSSIDQMRAYGDLVVQVSKSLDDFTRDALGPNSENAVLVLKNDLGLTIPTGATPELTLTEAQHATVTKTFAAIKVDGKGISDAGNLPALTGTTTKTAKVALAKLTPFAAELIKADALDKHTLLRTILQLGMQKIVVDRGSIRTKLTFSVDIDTSESSINKDTSSNSGSSGGGGFGIGSLVGFIPGVFAGLAGGAGGGFGNNSSLRVKLVDERSSAATNISADIIGEVRIDFRTDSFPATTF